MEKNEVTITKVVSFGPKQVAILGVIRGTTEITEIGFNSSMKISNFYLEYDYSQKKINYYQLWDTTNKFYGASYDDASKKVYLIGIKDTNILMKMSRKTDSTKQFESDPHLYFYYSILDVSNDYILAYSNNIFSLFDYNLKKIIDDEKISGKNLVSGKIFQNRKIAIYVEITSSTTIGSINICETEIKKFSTTTPPTTTSASSSSSTTATTTTTTTSTTSSSTTTSSTIPVTSTTSTTTQSQNTSPPKEETNSSQTTWGIVTLIIVIISVISYFVWQFWKKRKPFNITFS